MLYLANPLVLDSEVAFYLFGVINNAAMNIQVHQCLHRFQWIPKGRIVLIDIVRFPPNKACASWPRSQNATLVPSPMLDLKSNHCRFKSHICKSHECPIEHLRLRTWWGCWELERGPTVPARGTGVSPLPWHHKQPATRHSQTPQERCQQEGPFITCLLWPDPLDTF